MDYAALGVAGIATLVAVTVLSRRIRVATPLMLVLVGVAVSFLPGVPPVEVPPELILAGVLPPLLYGAAVTVPLVDLRRNLRSIVSLSVALVLVSSFGIGLLMHALFPGLSFAGALALGAVVSPPDAVAATSIARRLGLPPRLVTVLEGEGLVNDATALVLLRTSIAAVGATVDVWQAAGGFVLSAVVALVIGIAVGFLTTEVRRRLDDPVLDTAISFAVPFVAFIPAEELGASGRARRRGGRDLVRPPQRVDAVGAVADQRAAQLAHGAVPARERRLPRDGARAARHRRRGARGGPRGRHGGGVRGPHARRADAHPLRLPRAAAASASAATSSTPPSARGGCGAGSSASAGRAGTTGRPGASGRRPACSAAAARTSRRCARRASAGAAASSSAGPACAAW
ncbi:cation:proton antiporter [Clavibacter zhangzhiyongii]|uniref:cation:proton antiporter n=1 Tax=Clavibacter zhangzhiyongii TaxID=2768071 RepID=UPI0039E192A2